LKTNSGTMLFNNMLQSK